MPVQILIRLAEDNLFRLEAIVLQKGLRRPQKTELAILPEIAERSIPAKIPPEEFRQPASGRMLRFRQSRPLLRHSDCHHHSGILPIGEQHHSALPPVVIAMPIAYAEAA